MASQPLRPYLLAQLGWVGFLRDDSKKHTHTQSSIWWFQPIRKILVKLDHFPK